MLCGEKDFTKHNKINVFCNIDDNDEKKNNNCGEIHYYTSKQNDLTSNGVKIDMIACYDYRNLIHILSLLKQWLVVNELYLQCFSNSNKSEASTATTAAASAATGAQSIADINKKQSRIERHFEIVIENGKGDVNGSSNNYGTDSVGFTKINVTNINVNRRFGKAKINANKDAVKNWTCSFMVDVEKNIYQCHVTAHSPSSSSCIANLDNVDKKISQIFDISKSIPITLYYVAKLFNN